MSVTELSEHTKCEQSLISHHLNSMRTNGVLVLERSGKNIFYSLANKEFMNLAKCAGIKTQVI